MRSLGLVKEQFVYEEAPFPSCHASTIVEITGAPESTSDRDRGTLVAAFFGGKDEGDPSVGIWLSRLGRSGSWDAPREVADGVQTDGRRYPTWNPVLFEGPDERLFLFYKVGPNPRQWWGEWKVSSDAGRTWSSATRLDEGLLGPVRSKPLRLRDGAFLFGSSTEHDGWRLHFEQMTTGSPLDADADADANANANANVNVNVNVNAGADLGVAVVRLGEVDQAREGTGLIQAIQPSFLQHGDGRIQALCRTKQARIGSTSSVDGGRTWSQLELLALPNPDAGVEALTLHDGRHLLVYNHKVREGGTLGRLALSPQCRGVG